MNSTLNRRRTFDWVILDLLTSQDTLFVERPQNVGKSITSMSGWDQGFVDEEEEGYFEFIGEGRGEFHFGYVHGCMDCQLTMRDEESAIEWTWIGNDEMDAVEGRGWAVVRGDELHGMIFFHLGDDSEFIAKKKLHGRVTK